MSTIARLPSLTLAGARETIQAMRICSLAPLILGAGLIGCSGGGGDDGTTLSAGSDTTSDSSTAGTDSESGSTTDDGTDGSDATGMVPKLDVGAEDETGTGGEPGCKKVDFLFIIDDSGSMRDEQDRLVAAFPGFIQAIKDQVEGQDHHIMVIDSDENPAWLCEEFLDGAHCEGSNMQPDCGQYPCGSIDMLGQCDVTLGAGVTQPYGGYASNMSCGFPNDRRYLTDADDDLTGKFACAAKVGISGNGDELPMTAMLEALGDTLAQPGGCNEGFLRDDAILVVTLVSDDLQSMFAPNDDASAGDPMAWHDGLVAAKNGNENALTVIGLVAVDDVSCVFPMEECTNFVDFIEAFGDKGVLSSVCDDDYADVFAEAVGVIDTTCDEFEPEG